MIATPQLAKADTVLSGPQTTPQIAPVDPDGVNTVTTTDDFDVNTNDPGNAVSIIDTGSLTYDDGTNNSSLVTTNGSGLYIISLGDHAGPPSTLGSITITTGGNISGSIYGINASNLGSGSVSVTTTGTVETTTDSADDGIYAGNALAIGNDVTISAGDVAGNGNVTGNVNGIYAFNGGTGNTSVTATSTVTGTTGHGILVAHSGADLTVEAANVTGGVDGLHIENSGTGLTDITTTGTVTGTTSDGINVSDTAINVGGITIATAAVTGGINGINVSSLGTGNTSVTSTDTVTGTTGHGISVIHSGADLTVEAANVTGGVDGLHIENNGAGLTDITTTGTVAGTAGAGIYVFSQSTGNTSIISTGTVTSETDHGINVSDTVANVGGLTIEAADVTGNINGINVNSNGTGNTSVTGTETGTVTGTTGYGISVIHSGADLTVEAANVTGGVDGLHIENHGTGLTDITTTGTVTATDNANGNGIFAYNYAGSGNLVINAADINANSRGIFANNVGTGNVDVTVTGTVTIEGASGIGVQVLNFGGSDVAVETASVLGNASSGIEVSNYGVSGLTSVTTNGIVEGSITGIDFTSNSTQASTITINEGSEVRNTSGSSSALAVRTFGNAGGITDIINNGLITGTVSLNDQDDTLNNVGVWNTAGGSSNFLGGTDVLNNSGVFLAANTTGPVATTLTNLEVVNHTGDIVMQNMDARIGGLTAYAGDVTTFSASGSGDFQSNGGNLYLDTDFGDGTSDRLVVDNVSVTGGPTVVYINAIGIGQSTSGDGIEVIDVLGASANNAFVLAEPISGGLFNYNLGQGSSDTQSWFLQSNLRDEAVAAGALSALGSRTALATLSNLNERQRGGETFSDDQTGRKGIWARVFGQNSEFHSDGGTRAGYDANTWGAQAGLDLYAKGGEDGERQYAGVYIGHASSNGDALRGSSRIGRLDVDATSLGAYFTKYSARGWYVDATAQYSKLGGIRLRSAGDTVRPDGKSYALSLEGGQRFNRDSKVNTELQAQLIYQHTDIDDVTLNDSSRLNIGGVNAVTGRLGVRLAKNPEYAGRFQPWVRANLWHTFDKDANVSSQGATASTPIGGTSGEVQVGFALAPSQAGGWSAYVAGGYLFDLSGSEYSGWKGTLGVRKGW